MKKLQVGVRKTNTWHTYPKKKRKEKSEISTMSDHLSLELLQHLFPDLEAYHPLVHCHSLLDHHQSHERLWYCIFFKKNSKLSNSNCSCSLSSSSLYQQVAYIPSKALFAFSFALIRSEALTSLCSVDSAFRSSPLTLLTSFSLVSSSLGA